MHATLQLDQNHSKGNSKLFFTVWVWLLVITAAEIFLAYERIEVHLMITILLGLSLIKSALILAYFMHLRFERLGLFLMVVPVIVLCVCLMMIVFFPDSLRLTHLPQY
jgi:cytochrome c oxidase subunit 4